MSLKTIEELPDTIPADDFHALEDKIYRTIELLKAAREAKFTAERTAGRLREQLEAGQNEMQLLRNENIALRREREEVRTRIEKMLKQIEALTHEESGG